MTLSIVCAAPRVKSLFLVLGLGLVVHSKAAGIPQNLECPTSIQESSVHLVNTPQGWTSYVGSPLYLHGAAPMNGPPDKLGELADFRQKYSKKAWTYTYELDGKFEEGKWLACTYGESDQVTLSKRLDDSIRSCAFTYHKGKYVGQNDIKIQCK